MTFSRQAAIVGVGQTEFSKDSGRSELRLSAEAAIAALRDAGLDRSEVDGMVTFDMDETPEVLLANTLGLDRLTYWGRTYYGGGGACGVIQQAAMAIATGTATTVLVYRALNERSGRRFGSGSVPEPTPPISPLDASFSWVRPFGVITPAAYIALFARRYMHQSGATSRDFGAVTVQARAYAATNPSAHFYQRPITIEDHQVSRPIVDPLRLLDCCQETDGAVAAVLTSSGRARECAQPPVMVAAAAQGAEVPQEFMGSFYRDDIGSLPEVATVARQLYEQAGIGPDDFDVAMLYDHFSPMVLMQLESFGICDRGEAPDFISQGNLALSGRLPTNTHGGQLGEAYLHGMNGLTEAVRQLRGTAINQVAGAERALVSAGTGGLPTSAVVLEADA